nr:unnamed protein product [Callosobruchus analis]
MYKVREEKKRLQKKQNRQKSSRKMNPVYNVNVNSQNIRIYKTEFLNVHGLQSSHGRIKRIVSRKIQGALVPDEDQRGRHKNRSNQLSDEEKQHVWDHINLTPKYQNVTITILYKEFYISWCGERGIIPFCTELNIAFKISKSDTCKTCDESMIKIDTAKHDNSEE